jgi:O-antigen/teichoic acid export membrane protein
MSFISKPVDHAAKAADAKRFGGGALSSVAGWSLAKTKAAALTNMRGVMALASGAAAAQLVAALAIPWLARLYTPEDFGAFAVFFLGSQLLGTCLAGRFDQAIMMGKSRKQAASLAGLAFIVALSATLPLLLLLSLAHSTLDGLLGLALGPAWALIAIAGFMVSSANILSTFALKIHDNKTAATARLVKAMAAVVLQLAIGVFAKIGHLGLIIGEVLACIVVVGVLLYSVHRHLRAQDQSGRVIGLERLRWIALARRFRDYPLVSMPHVLIGGVGFWLTTFLVTKLFSAAESGQYFMMYRVVMLPASIVGTAAAQVYFRAAAESYFEKNRFGSEAIQVTVGLGAIGAALGFVLALWGQSLFVFVLGADWLQAGKLAEVFWPYVAIHLVITSLAPTMMITRQLRLSFLFSIVQVAIYVTAMLGGAKAFMTLEGAVTAAAFCSVPFMLALLAAYLWIARGAEISQFAGWRASDA